MIEAIITWLLLGLVAMGILALLLIPILLFLGLLKAWFTATTKPHLSKEIEVEADIGEEHAGLLAENEEDESEALFWDGEDN